MTTMTKTHEDNAIDSTMLGESVGLGQLIKGATGRVGIQPCASCERRAQRLDRWVRFGSVRADRRSVVVFAVVGVSAVGGSVAGGMLGRRVGAAVGTRLRDKLRDRGTRPERLDSVVGYAEKSGMVLGSVVGGTCAVLVVLTLANRILINNPATIPSIPKLDDLPALPPGRHPGFACAGKLVRCFDKAHTDLTNAVRVCRHDPVCIRGANNAWTDAINACLAFLKTDHENCGTCGNACDASMMCVNGSCICPPGTHRCGFPKTICCQPGLDCLLCSHGPVCHDPNDRTNPC